MPPDRAPADRERVLPIGDHRALGAGAGAALLLPDATVDWWCAPRVDDPPRLWRLLDVDGPAAAYLGVEPMGMRSGAAGPTARTVVRAACGPVELWDALVDDRLVRLARCPSSPLHIEHRVEVGGWDGAPRTAPVTLALRAPAGEWACLEVDGAGARLADAGEPVRRLRGLEARVADLVSGVRLPRRHRDRVLDALSVVGTCTHAATGAIVAAPTTSLPEAPGHDRQFDYRYAWLRDGSLVASVAALLGRPDIARRHLDFVFGLGDRIFDSPVFAVDGGPVPCERVVDGVQGWLGSRPVRVGNAAAVQVQYDALGFVVAAVADYISSGGRDHRNLWALTKGIADRVVARDEPATSGIWELRRPDNLLCAEIGRWIALDRALRVGGWLRPWQRHHDWATARDACRSLVLSQLQPDGRLPQVHDGDPDRLDASALLIVIMGMLDADDERAHRLVDAHLQALGDGPFLRRYPPGSDDGFTGCEGAFLPCSWWAVSALARLGRVGEAVERADQLCALLPAAVSEEIDPPSGALLGNVPLVWSHMELARALYLIDTEERRAAEGDLRVRLAAGARLVRGLARPARWRFWEPD